jgi:hypothetical protein
MADSLLVDCLLRPKDLAFGTCGSGRVSEGFFWCYTAGTHAGPWLRLHALLDVDLTIHLGEVTLRKATLRHDISINAVLLIRFISTPSRRTEF